MKALSALLCAAFISILPTAVHAQQTYIGSQCSLPGPINDTSCTVLYHVNNNPSNNIVCLWDAITNGLAACEGRSRWGAGYDYVPAAGTTLEFRRHSGWPALHPLWPNAAAVRATGTLLRSQPVAARHRAAPAVACDVIVAPGASIQSAINTAGVTTVCLSPGIHIVNTQLMPKAGQTIATHPASNPAVLQPAAGIRVLSVEASNVTLRDFHIDALPAARPGFGIRVYGATNVLMERLKVSRALIGVGVSGGASNVEIRQSEIAFAGDGQACSGCAHPSIWISDSNDVRVIKSSLLNNGIGPEGDGELACYNTPNLVVHNSTITNSGAAGMYLVNCDYAVVSGNDIIGAEEWGLDLVNTGQPSGTDYGLFSWNSISGSRHGAGVVQNSIQNTFQNNNYTNNRTGPNASGSCNGINRRGNTSGYYYINDVASPWPVVCND